MGNLGNLIQILVFVAVFLGPAIGAIAKKLKAHAEEKRIEAERQKRRIEAIRTGQVTGEFADADPNRRSPAIQTANQPTKTAAQSRTEAAEAARRQRQAQIAELRRRYQEQQARQRAQQSQQPAQRPTAQPSRPPAQQPARPQPQPRTSGSSAAAQRQAELARRREEIRRRREAIAAQRDPNRSSSSASGKQSKPTPKPVTRRASKTGKEPILQEAPKGPAPAHWTAPASRQGGLAGMLRNTGELRRAIILAEILEPPVSMRPPADR